MIDKNTKILIINTYFSPIGGAEVISYNTYNILKNHGYNVFFWGCNKKPFFDETYKYQKYFTNFNKYNYLNYYYNLKAKNDLQNFINYIKPDIIHLHNFISYLSPSILNSCKGIPTVATIHDSTLVCPAVTLWQNNSLCIPTLCKNKKYYNCILKNCAKKGFEASFRKTVRNYITMRLIKYIDKFISPSNALKNIITSSNIGIKNKNIHTIYNFLLKEDFQVKPNFTNKSYFLYVGRLSPEKGIDYLLAAMTSLPRDIKLKIVGQGNEEQNLKKYAKIHNLNNVEFVGFKNKNELKIEYQNCIATILPSICFDNFPTTNMESFINGKPVIASDIGGIPEQVEHNKTGLLFEPANVEQLKDCILTYWHNPELVVEHGKNCYQKAWEKYSEDKYFENILEIYNDLIRN